MIWTLENVAFVVIIIAAAFGALMAIVNIACDIIKVTPWYIKYHEKTPVRKAEQIVEENCIRYECPECGNVVFHSRHIENYCNRCGRAITEEEKKKYESE